MIDPAFARDGAAMLFTVAGMLLEDALPSLVRASTPEGEGSGRATRLLQLGDDVAALAAAAGVLARRSTEGPS